MVPRINLTWIHFALSGLLAGVALLPFPPSAKAQMRTDRGEEYYLIRTLEGLYEQLPMQATDPSEFQEAAAELRREAIRYKVRADEARLHESIGTGFDDFVAQLDAISLFFSEIEKIQTNATAQKPGQAFDSGFKGGQAAAVTANLAAQSDFSTMEGALASILVGGLVYAVDSWNQSSALDQSVKEAVEAEAKQLQDALMQRLERSRQRFLDLARQKGWPEREIGWDLSTQSANDTMRMIQNGDVGGLISVAAAKRAERPFDPLIALSHNLLMAIGSGESPSDLDRICEDSLNQKALIPAHSVYDHHRLAVLSQAALLASASRQAERMGGASPRSSSRSRRAVELWEAAHEARTPDTGDEVALYRACAYAGDGETAKARTELRALYDRMKDQPDYLYACACVFCLDGDRNLALKFLDQAIRTDEFELVQVRMDPDLQDLRATQEFATLTTPQWGWNMVNSFIWTDVVLQNKSAFTLTNVRLISDNPEWQPDLTVDVLPPGQTKKWEWNSQPPEGAKIQLRLTSDQDP
ncbi:MAG: hypothetical protein DVB23_001227 [Verrucomicrobia bacterium]|nr:MAG: hypothetical protein DVB23_001227 [Verrucomicrobiota bacterium]